MSAVSYLEPAGLAEVFERARLEAQAATTRTWQAHTDYQTRPLDWMVDKLGVKREDVLWHLYGGEYETHEWDGTQDPLNELLLALAQGTRIIAVEAANGVSKTWLAARIVLWFFACHENAIVVTVAPKLEQLRKLLWKEIISIWPTFRVHFPEAVYSQGRIVMSKAIGEKWAVSAFGAGVSADEVKASATRAQGFHGEHMLIVFEETPGIHPAIMTAFKNTCTAPHNIRLALGNPDHQMDELHLLARTPGARHIRISAFDFPNVVLNRQVIPGAVSRESIEEKRHDYGEGSPMYESRVRGVSPAQAVNALFQLDWLLRAVERGKDPDTLGKTRKGRKAMGIDCAQSLNGDRAATSYWEGSACIKVVAEPCPNATQYGRDRVTEALLDLIAPGNIAVDPAGVGAATANELVEHLGPEVNLLGAALSPIKRTQRADDGSDFEWVPDENRFKSLRDQITWQFREDLRNDRIILPDDKDLIRQLRLFTYKLQNGKVVVLPKDEIKQQLGGHSPDEAEAVIMGNWARRRETLPPAPPAPINPLERDPFDPLQPDATRWDDHDPLGGLPSDY